MKKKLSKLFALTLVLIMVFALAACGEQGGQQPAGGDTSGTGGDTSGTGGDTSGTGGDTSGTGGDTSGSGGDKLSIGATYYTLQTEFCMRMDNAAQKWAAENNVNYVGYDGQNDAATQLQQVETMISNGVDAIILNPQDADACAACVDAAVAAGIPVIGVNTMVNSDKLTAYVGSQDVSAGEEIMEKMIEHMGTNAFNIVVIEGPMGQSAQLQRWEGINNVLAENPDIKILDYNTANWVRAEAMTLMETWITTYGDDIDAVIGENDEMALGAREAIKAAGMDIPCIGIDGITDAVTAVQNGDMIASDFQDAEGQITGALEAAVKVVNGESVEKEIWIPFQMITPENADEFVDRY